MSGNISFPTNPTVGQLYTFNGITWQWNGTAWVNANTGGNFMPIGGGTFQGPVTLSGIGTQPLSPAAVQQLYLPNYVDNSSFTINQRAYASGAALGAGVYGFDRWKGGAAGGTLTYSNASGFTAVTVTAGSIMEVMEANCFIPGATYVLSWQGTATGRVYISGGSAPAYAASPITFTPVASDNYMIEFAGGTLFQPKVSLGSVATPWEPISVPIEILRCLRFYLNLGAVTFGGPTGTGSGGAVTMSTLSLPVPMRVSPAVGLGTWSYAGSANGIAPGSVTPYGWAPAINFTTAAGAWGATGQATFTADL